ncbi:DJ-1/PfpI family protein [Trebonia sp.]|uniref:GlxA family transcriptional regulator n=1 Tax=Trebonia sp. TaxID=2767075 RepID=UPI00262FCD42|nr:DJ-1/PfpI family protein [Trebonia sp.]
MPTVLIALFDGVQSLDVTGPLEVFDHANAVHPGAYRIITASLRGRAITTSSNLKLTPDADLHDIAGQHLDLLLVPGGPGARQRDADLVRSLKTHAQNSKRLASVCTGAFLLAAAGLLDGRTVTTHWQYCDELARQYPRVTVDPDPIFIKTADLATSAGVTAGVDLALALVEDDLGRDTALAVARALVVFLRRPGSQAQFSAQLSAQVANRAPLREVQHWIAEHPAADLSVEALAQRASLSPRHFARAFAAEVGVPPGRYVDRSRFEAARRHLEDSEEGVEETARACGYGTPEAMRRAFVRSLGVSPAEYRRRFRPKAPPQEEFRADRHRAL